MPEAAYNEIAPNERVPSKIIYFNPFANLPNEFPSDLQIIQKQRQDSGDQIEIADKQEDLDECVIKPKSDNGLNNGLVLDEKQNSKALSAASDK